MKSPIIKDEKIKRIFSITYGVVFCILAIIAVHIAICDLTTGITEEQIATDNLITIVFIIDYIVRLILSKSKKEFFKENVLDLIAIIPFTSLFKICRIMKFFRLLKILRILKIVRLVSYVARFYKRIKFFFDINGLKYMVIVSITCIVLGGIAIHFAEGMNIFDGIWWSFVTATTVGYGDISPSTPFGRIIAAILMVVGIGLIGSLTSTLTALFFQKHDEEREHLSTKEQLLKTIQSQLNEFDNLTDEDIETICTTIRNLHNKKDDTLS